MQSCKGDYKNLHPRPLSKKCRHGEKRKFPVMKGKKSQGIYL